MDGNTDVRKLFARELHKTQIFEVKHRTTALLNCCPDFAMPGLVTMKVKCLVILECLVTNVTADPELGGPLFQICFQSSQ
jgi:hypothetical protein